MPVGDTLTPKEAAYIATNCYFTLKDWIHEKPIAGMESRSNITNRVIGKANVGSSSHADTSLESTGLSGGRLGNKKWPPIFGQLLKCILPSLTMLLPAA